MISSIQKKKLLFRHKWRMFTIFVWNAYCRMTKKRVHCMSCKKNLKPADIEVDHIIPRSRAFLDPWNPGNAQILCHNCNMEKGSKLHPDLDFRPFPFTVFQARLVEKWWFQENGKWFLKKGLLDKDK